MGIYGGCSSSPQRSPTSQLPANPIEPVGQWIWGKLVNGFVYNAPRAFGGGNSGQQACPPPGRCSPPTTASPPCWPPSPLPSPTAPTSSHPSPSLLRPTPLLQNCLRALLRSF